MDPTTPGRPPALHKESFDAAMARCNEIPNYLVDDLLYEDASFMLTADAGVGKSTISLCAAAAMTSGAPVFGQFAMAKPLRVYYALGERNAKEPMRRLKVMNPALPVNRDNWWLTDAFTGTCDLLNPAHVDDFIRTVARDCPDGPEVIFLDPIYPFVSGALSEDRVGNLLTQRFTRIKKVFGCALWFTHHNIKPRQGEGGAYSRPVNPFFGSIWIYTHIVTQYNVERGGSNKTNLTRLKDSEETLLPTIPLDFDRDTHVVTLSDDLGPLNKTNRCHLFLRAREVDRKRWTRDEIMAQTGVSHTQMHRIYGTPPWEGRIANVSPVGKEGCYEVRKAV